MRPTKLKLYKGECTLFRLVDSETGETLGSLDVFYGSDGVLIKIEHNARINMGITV